MKIILVTLSDLLPIAFDQVLNPKNKYCRVVVDEPEVAMKFFSQFNLPEVFIRPLYDLKEIISTSNYDCVLCFSDRRIVVSIPDFVKYCGVPKNKFVHFYLAADGNICFIIDRALRYFKEHSAEFEMFATGMSYTSFALDTNQFKHKLFNFAKASQDLYFDYQIAKFAIQGGA